MFKLKAELLTKYQRLRLALNQCIRNKHIIGKNSLLGMPLHPLIDVLDDNTMQFIYKEEKLATIIGNNVFLLVEFDKNLTGTLSLKGFDLILKGVTSIGEVTVSPIYKNGSKIKLRGI